MGFQTQYQYLKAFGLGQRTTLNFPDENPGILKWWQQWEGTEKFTVAYGQGVASSPIQLIAAVNAIANGGTYVPPDWCRPRSTTGAWSARCRRRRTMRSSSPRRPRRCVR